LYKALTLSAVGKHKSALAVIDDYLKEHFSDKLAKIYRVQLLRNDGQYESSLKQLNQIYIADGFEPIISTGDKCELNISQIQCAPKYKIVSEEMVSVVMTHYQRDELLSISIKSVLNQTYSNLELIIVDDGGSDETWQWLQEFAAQDQRIKLLKMPKNVGT
ncbi:MAG: glycosyltransferase family 2 protein, partial [Cyanobacteria bacterium J06623_7]